MENNKIDYLLVGIVIALTGFEIAFRASILIQLGVLICIAVYFFWIGKRFSNVFFIIVTPLILAIFLQAIFFQNIYLFIANSIAIMVKFLTCYMVLEIVKNRFNKTFVGFIYFLAIFSLIFYPTQFFPGIQDTIKNGIGSLIKPIGSANIPPWLVSKTLIFFTYHHGHGFEIVGEYRNCGAFWEPGVFAIFLNIALLINLFINKTALFSLKNVVFIIAEITTFSTTGFIVLFLIIISSLILNKKIELVLLYIPLLITILLLSYTFVWKLDFMSEKISDQANNASYSRSSRFGAALYHFEELKESPLTGVSLGVAEREKDQRFEDRIVTPNGISIIFFVWGIPVGLLYYIFFYMGLSRWLRFHRIDNRLIHFLFFFIFILSAFSQDLTNRHFYFMILFFVACFPRNPIPIPIVLKNKNK